MGDAPEGAVVADGLRFPEGPRWRDGALWFSDMHAGTVHRLDPKTGECSVVASVDGLPSGLGWTPDGDLLVVSMRDRRLLRRVADGGLHEVADLSRVAPADCNDMVVDDRGRAYVGNFGFDLHGGAPPAPTGLALVEVDGSVQVVADDLLFPNGMVLTPDGRTLLVAETFGARLSAFTVNADGTLGERRLFAALGAAMPDGICLDAEGAVWVASPASDEVIRVADGGAVLDRVPLPQAPYACMLGGDDRRTLFVLTASSIQAAVTALRHDGCIRALPVAVPGAGLP